MFVRRNNKHNVYRCKSQFFYIKVGFMGVKIIRACFHDVVFIFSCALVRLSILFIALFFFKLQLANILLSHNVRKCTFGHVRPAKIQISLRIRAGWSESSLGAIWIAKDAKFLHADNEDSDQTARMCRSIWIFSGVHMHKIRFLTYRHICTYVTVI